MAVRCGGMVLIITFKESGPWISSSEFTSKHLRSFPADCIAVLYREKPSRFNVFYSFSHRFLPRPLSSSLNLLCHIHLRKLPGAQLIDTTTILPIPLTETPFCSSTTKLCRRFQFCHSISPLESHPNRRNFTLLPSLLRHPRLLTKVQS